jgi:hypothetical protein
MIIEDAYDAFHATVIDAINTYGSTLTPAIEYKELNDNVLIENNNELDLRNGFAVEFAGDVNAETMLSGNTELNQTVYVTFTTANNGTLRNNTKRKEAEKRLLAIKDQVVRAIGRNPQLNDTVAKCIYKQTDPVALIMNDEEKVYLMIRSTYEIGYFEQSAF